MLRWAIGFLVVALSAALLDLSQIATAAFGIGQLLFVIFLVEIVVAGLVGFFRNRSRRTSRS